jgi:hypothetical protein
MYELTGKTSFRAAKRLFRQPIMVLQVEVITYYWSHEDPLDSRNGTEIRAYKDATLQDFIELGRPKIKEQTPTKP